MKYFQNVMESIRDLLSPLAQEKSYKVGMKKDKDGFMDVGWCQSVILESWTDLTNCIQQANGRKAIVFAPPNSIISRLVGIVFLFSQQSSMCAIWVAQNQL